MIIDKFIRTYASSSPEIEKANYVRGDTRTDAVDRAAIREAGEEKPRRS